MVIPFSDLHGTLRGYSRVKPRHPRSDKDGKVVKYESPIGAGNHLYLPPSALIAFQTPKQLVAITEGEKKSLCVSACCVPCAAVTGVWNWVVGQKKETASGAPTQKAKKEPRKPIPDLLAVDWTRRPVLLLPDTDPRRNPSVNQAFAELAHALSELGADVQIIELPPGPRDANGIHTKMAADDFIVAHGPELLWQLIRGQVL